MSAAGTQGAQPDAGVFAALFPAELRGSAGAQREFLCTPEGRRLSYAQVLGDSARLAHALRASGIVPGDRVAVQVDKTPEALLVYFAVLRAGAVYLPLNSAYTGAELEYFLRDAEPALLLATSERRASLAALCARVGVARLLTLEPGGQDSLLQAAAVQPVEFEDVARAPSDPAAILYTSGTTGRSKGAVLTQANLISNARTLAACWRFSARDRLLHALPIFHIHGLFVAVNVTLASGAALLLLPRFDPALVLHHLPDCSVLMGVPTFYVRLLREAALNHAVTAKVRLFVSGSAPLLAETFQAWQQRTGHTILERYGMSETGMNCSNPYEGARVPGSVGPPLPGVQVRITDPASGAPLPAGSIGMIEVRGPNVFAGYWRQPELTREQLRSDGWFISGDLGRMDAGGYVYIVGRGKDLIISGGYNVYPREVELQLDALPGVLESAVIGLPHDDYGEAVTALVVALPGQTPSEQVLLRSLRERLAAYKLPKRILFVSELPRNLMGKVQKAQLRATHAALYAR